MLGYEVYKCMCCDRESKSRDGVWTAFVTIPATMLPVEERETLCSDCRPRLRKLLAGDENGVPGPAGPAGPAGNPIGPSPNGDAYDLPRKEG